MNQKSLRASVALGALVLCGLLFLPHCTYSENAPFQLNVNKLYGKNNMVDVAVIGSGPAGSAAALYAAQDNLHVVVFEGMEPGGLLTKTSYVENYPGAGKILGPDLVQKIKEDAQRSGAIYVPDYVSAVDLSQWPFVISLDDGTTINALSLILATGAVPYKLKVPGEEEFWGSGVSSCAVCDGRFFEDLDVVVVGGGDSACEEAMQLARAKVRTVTILVRGVKMRASDAMQERLKGYPTIHVRYNVEVKEIIGVDSQVREVKLFNNKDNSYELMPTRGVFLAIGHQPNTQLIKGQITLDEKGYVITKGRSQHTSIPGVYACGDVEDSVYRQAIVAAGSGARAGLDVRAWLTDGGFTPQIAAQFEAFYYAKNNEAKSQIASIDTESFTSQVLQATTPVIVDFYGPNCPTCDQQAIILTALASQYADKVRIVKVDISASPELVQKWKINKIPTVLVFNKGSLVARYSTLASKNDIQEIIATIIS